jgi:hypothetical protein
MWGRARRLRCRRTRARVHVEASPDHRRQGNVQPQGFYVRLPPGLEHAGSKSAVGPFGPAAAPEVRVAPGPKISPRAGAHKAVLKLQSDAAFGRSAHPSHASRVASGETFCAARIRPSPQGEVLSAGHGPAGNVLDFAAGPDHSPPNFDAEGALWRKKRCSNFRE